MPTSLSFSVVIEWDNARLADLSRVRRMLAELFAQVAALPATETQFENAIVAYDPSKMDEALMRRVVVEYAGDRHATRVKFVARPGASGYYELKNLGAEQARGDIVIFLDSDVIPAPGWLESLLSAFDDSRVEVACGGSFISPHGLYAKSFALFWFFPLRSEAHGLRKTHHFFANNVAFRRQTIASYPFPDLAQSRGQCIALAATLIANGIGVFRQEEAWVAHPPPNGIRHFCARAITQGHDRLANVRRDQKGRAPPLKTTYWAYIANLRSALTRITQHFRDVDLGRGGAVIAILLATLYYTLMAAGEILTRACPGLVQRHLLV